MATIEFERWERSEHDPGRLEYAGQRNAAEVFEELCARLELQGCLPEEYFLMDPAWGNGREIPKDADIFCTTDYGGSEGIYIDVCLKWYEDGKPVIKTFATGKTLGDTGADLDRMFLVASAITKAFHGDGGSYPRYMQVGGPSPDAPGAVVFLNRAEQEIVMGALLDQRLQQENALTQTEQLLRRLAGSVTAYMDTVGQRPLKLSDFDRAMLAIRDGELDAFKAAYPKALAQADELLIETAGRPGIVGRQMTLLLWADIECFSGSAYRTACERAVDIHDKQKLLFLLEEAAGHVKDLPESFCGELARYAYREQKDLAREIVKWCTPKQIAVAPSRLLLDALPDQDFSTAKMLTEKGIDANESFAYVALWCVRQHCEWQLDLLLKNGLHVSVENFTAMSACVEHGLTDLGKRLLDRGMDFEAFRAWADRQPQRVQNMETLNDLQEYWREMQGDQSQADMPESQEKPENGGMVLG
ncbi:MAG: ankyrin repeat domain-containing protein [Subdoligranulum sp.]|nr:ankyrin repeat domain-containing protein [Subdoligranulum sp.]